MYIFGVRGVSLDYLSRASEDTKHGNNPPNILEGRAHWYEFGLIEKEFIKLLTHDHVLYNQYNGALLDKLAIGLSHSTYTTVLDRFSNNRNGGWAFLALKATFPGKAVCEKTIKDSANLMENSKLNGTTYITLERHTIGHQEGYISITEAVDHVQHQILTDQTRCTKFIGSFDCNDSNILYVLAAEDNDYHETRYNFEACVAYLILMDPVKVKKVKADPNTRIGYVVAAV